MSSRFDAVLDNLSELYEEVKTLKRLYIEASEAVPKLHAAREAAEDERDRWKKAFDDAQKEERERIIKLIQNTEERKWGCWDPALIDAIRGKP